MGQGIIRMTPFVLLATAAACGPPVEGEVAGGDAVAVEATWATDASAWRGRTGAAVTVRCPPNDRPAGTVVGTDVYADDSSVCLAAVHAGKLVPSRGGVVTVLVQPGFANYPGTERAGVTSRSAGAAPGSFSFEPVAVRSLAWHETAAEYRGRPGSAIAFSCPADPARESIWGTEVYTDDSAVCSAAVHAGVLRAGDGGPVLVVMLAGRPRYTGTARHGVASLDYGKWVGSFRFR